MKNTLLLLMGMFTFMAQGENNTTRSSGDIAWIARFSCSGKMGSGSDAYNAIFEGGYGGIYSGTSLPTETGAANGVFAAAGVYRDGKGDHADFRDYFQNTELVGILRMNDQHQPLDFSVTGPQLPNKRNIQLVIPLDSANTVGTFVMQKQDEFGGNVQGSLACKILLPGQCRTENVCHRGCHRAAGCSTVCEPQTTCF